MRTALFTLWAISASQRRLAVLVTAYGPDPGLWDTHRFQTAKPATNQANPRGQIRRRSPGRIDRGRYGVVVLSISRRRAQARNGTSPTAPWRCRRGSEARPCVRADACFGLRSRPFSGSSVPARRRRRRCKIVFAGPPEEIVKVELSYTGRCSRPVLGRKLVVSTHASAAITSRWLTENITIFCFVLPKCVSGRGCCTPAWVAPRYDFRQFSTRSFGSAAGWFRSSRCPSRPAKRARTVYCLIFGRLLVVLFLSGGRALPHSRQ